MATAIHGASELDDPPVYFGALIALYTVAGRCERRTSYAVAALTVLALVASMALSRDTPAVTAALQFAVFGTAWILGDNVRVRRAYTAAVEQRAARLELEREQDVRRAAAEERARIARELHDVVAHHVSVIALQSHRSWHTAGEDRGDAERLASRWPANVKAESKRLAERCRT